jgi:3-methyladenine DNA glycosylase AlkD
VNSDPVEAEKFTAAAFEAELETLSTDEQLEAYQTRFQFEIGDQPDDDYFIGVRMGHLFDLAKEYVEMEPDEIETLLERPVHEARVGAVSIMDWQARRNSTPDERRRELYELYLRRHDRIDSWDLVDRAASHVVVGYLFEFDRPRDILFELAASEDVFERRTAIYSTSYFLRQGEYDITFEVAEALLEDEDESIQKAVGGWLREIGRRDRAL